MTSSQVLDRWLSINQTYRALDTQFMIAKAERDTALAMKAKAERELDRVPVAMRFLQALSDRVSGDILRSCEAAMTDGCRAIIGDDTEIGIETFVHRNQTKVSIGTALYPKDGSRILRDIVRDEGGGLTNVVAMILRIIAVARSEQRRFIILDEPDCYLNPLQIPPFFQIVKDMVDRAGFQIVLLTHHAQSVSSFGDDVNVITFERSAGEITASATHDGEVQDANSAHGVQTRNGIINGIRMQNFGKHKDLYLPLIRGLNVIVGPSNIGKSRILAAMRCVLCGDGADSVLHTTYNEENELTVAKSCCVEIDFDDNKKIKWVRRKSGSPVETWEFTQNGNVVTLPDGTLCSGKNGPDWVGLPQALNMRQIAGLWPALHFQKMPIFALDDGVALSGLMSISQTSVRLRAMLHVINERKRNAERDLREHNARLEELSKKIYWMDESLPQLKAVIDEAGNLYADVQARTTAIEHLTSYNAAYQAACDMTQRGKAIIQAALVTLPRLDDLDAMTNAVCDHDEARLAIWAGKSVISACERVTPSKITETDKLALAVKEYQRAVQSHERGAYIARIAHVIQPELPNASVMRSLYLDYAKSRARADVVIPEAVALPALVDTAEAATLLRDWNAAQVRQKTGARLASVGKDIVPPNTSLFDRQKDIAAFMDAYRAAQQRVQSGQAEESRLAAEIKSVNAEIEAQRVELGVCPLCGRV